MNACSARTEFAKAMSVSFRLGWGSVRANAVPMVALWLMSVGMVTGYYLLPEARTVFDRLGRFQRDYGIWAGFVSQFVFCGVIPCAFRLLVADVRTEHPVLKSFLQSLWCGCWGIVYVGFYGLQARLFGSGSDFATLAAKTAFDQFVWSPFLPVPCTAFFCLWMENGFSVRTAARKFRDDFVRRVWLANLLPNWCIWIPAVLAIYAFPTVLQVQILGLVGSFWALVSLRLARELSR